MTFNKSSLVGSLLLGLGLVWGQASAATAPVEWVTAAAADPYTVQPGPTNLMPQPQNPPAFAWPRYPVYPKPPGYILEVSSGGVVIGTYTTTRNFYLPSKAMTAAATGTTYSWRVRPNIAKVDWSTPRTFTLYPSAKVFEVPENDVLRARIIAHGRSRMLSKNFLPFSKWTSAMMAERGAAISALIREVTAGLTSPPAPAPQNLTAVPAVSDGMLLSSASTTPQVVALLPAKVNPVLRQLEASALLYRLMGDPKYLAEAIARGDQAAALDPSAITSYTSQDQVTRSIDVSLLRAVDMLWDNLDAARRTRWLAAITARTEAIYADLSGSDGRIDEQPFDSHGATAYGYLALIAAMTVGDVPAADKWFDFAVRPYVNSIFVWSGPEGGYFPGSAYAMYQATYSVQLWGPFKEATGVDLYQKPWSIGFGRMLMQFIPPGAAGLVFGDQHEVGFDYSALKSFAARTANAESAWYARTVTGSEDPIQLLTSEYPLPASAITPVVPPNAALFPTIGWVSMHSDITNTKRTSLYFKSSPYGSYNHAHGDQNALVLDSGGVRLLGEAGYEDYYYSPTVTAWYRTTRAHNAVTFDGGVGQLIGGRENLTRNGKITGFSTSAALDYAEGDATVSYGPAITSAVRKVWYLRTNNVYVVQDKITAPAAHKYEWNMHSTVPIVADGSSGAKIVNGTSSVCLTSLTPDTTLTSWTVPYPSRPKVVETHSAFIKNAAVQNTEFLVVLDVGCKRPVVTVTPGSNGRTLLVNGQSITLPN
ncbi:heparinase II/III domain-containing protein [Rugamonas rivuli]|uniref:DUF4962 domain-containing protein n=1 Tax=Rugamonas rivuli TaxID=2743358 RepID=A0A843S6K0_9BURK|nr:heparinase II/III family protein [Rugamonas rivuli]MQA19995.1 DUF4962 domain-containing protein [Rugamonas rivuli]